MACAQIAFFPWLILIFINKSYRPKWSAVLAAFILFLSILVVSSLIGVDFSQSFWSKFERMTGLLMWLHVFAFFLVLSSTLKTLVSWKKFFLASVMVSSIVALFSILEVLGSKTYSLYFKSLTDIKNSAFLVALKSMILADRGGLTLGNTSFLGTYLMFNFFLAVYLLFSNCKVFLAKNLKLVLGAVAAIIFFIGLLLFYQDYQMLQTDLSAFSLHAQSLRDLIIAAFGLLSFIWLILGTRVFAALAVFLTIVSLYWNEARAALGGAVIGSGLIFLLWLGFSNNDDKVYKKQTRIVGIVLLALLIIGFSVIFLLKRQLFDNIVGLLGRYNLQIVLYLALGFLVALGAWLAIRPLRGASFSKVTKIIGRALLGLSILIVLVVLILLFLPNNPVHNLFGQMGGNARFVNWSIAWKGFSERPILGWGPENYILVFPKFFNTCLFIPAECGGEIWFDRAHNIIFDTLITSGILGLLAYLGIILSVLWVLSKSYFQNQKATFWAFAVPGATLLAYFLQNLTVFDMATSLMMFAIILGFAASHHQPESNRGPKLINHFPTGPVVLASVLFALCFLLFIVQPIKSDGGVIEAMIKEQEMGNYARLMKENDKIEESGSLTQKQEVDLVNFVIQKRQEQLAEMKETLGASPLGKYQIREFFAQQFETALRDPAYSHYFNLSQEANMAIWQHSTTTFDFLIKELEKSIKESPYDYRSVLRLASLSSLYTKLDFSKSDLAEKAFAEGIKLSPNNQQNYWLLAQHRFWLAQVFAQEGRPNIEWQNKIEESLSFAMKAKELNERVWNSNAVLLYILKSAQELAQAKGDQASAQKYNSLMQKEITDALRINPSWESDLSSLRQQ
jgi:hypothetical protein